MATSRKLCGRVGLKIQVVRNLYLNFCNPRVLGHPYFYEDRNYLFATGGSWAPKLETNLRKRTLLPSLTSLLFPV